MAAVEIKLHNIFPVCTDLWVTVLLLGIYDVGDNLSKMVSVTARRWRNYNNPTFEYPLSSLDIAAHMEATIEQSVIASCARSRELSGTTLTHLCISLGRFHESNIVICASERGSIPEASLKGQQGFSHLLNIITSLLT